MPSLIQWQGEEIVAIETILKETRLFPPPEAFSAKSHVGDLNSYTTLVAKAEKDPVSFWEDAAKNIHWFKTWEKALEWNAPFAKWFIGGKTNASYNCLDKHLGTRTEHKEAIIWEGEDGTVVRLTYRELYEKVCALSNAMEHDLGLKTGDTAAIYMPMVPEAIVAMLACARIGVIHSVIFGGFASHAIRDRVNDADSKVIFTADIGYRRGQVLELKKIVDEAVKETPGVKKVVVLQREKNRNSLTGSLDLDWETLTKKQSKEHVAKQLDSETPLFFLYTSGTTGKPKGIVHTTGGYLVGTSLTAKWVFDLKQDDVFWCTADIGWITGHSYVVYGILSNGVTNLMYEGGPMHPTPSRMWEMIERHNVSIFYTAPTAIRALMRSGDEHPLSHPMPSLRLLGSVGEPINPEAWMWYHEKVGKGLCPIVDTWWQTETGAIMIAPLPGVTTLKPGSATKPFPGILIDVVNEEGKSCKGEEGGYLVIKHPWPSMLRTIHKDPERFKETYYSKFPGIYFTGDGANKDKDGYFWIKGRVDDVINVSGHRLGTMEIESALVSHPKVAEAAVVGRPDELKGQGIVAFVTPRDNAGTDYKQLIKELKEHVAKEIGALARPDDIKLTKTLPKTRSGKIMRRLLKDLAAGKALSGDTTTLENPGLIELLE